jgi:hypothetical protein
MPIGMAQVTDKKQEKQERDIVQNDVPFSEKPMSHFNSSADEATAARWRAEGREVGQVDPATVARWRRASATGKRRRIPDSWDQVHVLDRMEEAFETLGRMPMATRPKGHASIWPRYAYEHGDLIAQIETHELERMLRQRNRVRLPTTPAEIQRMNEALAWPMTHLRDNLEASQALQLACLWTVVRADIKERCRARGWNRRKFYRWKMDGARQIALGLIRANVPVN